MFEWLRRMIRGSSDENIDDFYSMIDELNTLGGGGKPTIVRQELGKLKVHSGTLSLGDPQSVGEVEVGGIAAKEATISATLWRYPSGKYTIAELTLRIGDSPENGSLRKIGAVGIDSAALVVADAADIKKHWTDVGKDRIGFISTAPDKKVLQALTKRFKFKTRIVNHIEAEIVGSVSQELEQDVLSYLSTIPKCANFPFIYFNVRTNNSFDRAIYREEAWKFIPVGNEPTPLMFVCDTGRGDGWYDVHGLFAGDEPRVLKIDFIQD